ncbi:hypothetical protein BDEG_23078 [Batrachochytrium dendrobatidis JEL423]|uniref:Uncharacterized protein n=1 Tax=Batrachochytrium dendrobatidis (strain JEL423) TaxID=403673 RepID=A0A177WHQ3_BATDL|nr:hypothetical protein BDEG_23078 [Batrachochytrium dendrobatidis JEL423]
MTHLQYSIRSYSHVSKNLLKKWKHYLLVEGSQQIMICWFWYIFLQQWRPDQTDNMNHLVRHASTLYVKLFLRYKGDDKDEFFQELPEFYSQAIYTAYRECFPLSHKHFDASFQIKLCDSMHRLMSDSQQASLLITLPARHGLMTCFPPRSWRGKKSWKTTHLNTAFGKKARHVGYHMADMKKYI